MTYRIRPATRDDVDTIVDLVRELAAFEREPASATATRDDFLRDGFGAQPLFRVLVAEDETGPLGMAFTFLKYSTWTGSPTLHLEDLFVREHARRRGIATAFMAELAREALRLGCKRLEWQVLDWNTDAIGFYEGLGAEIQRTWVPVRVDGGALVALAARRASE
jgi:GNAT superfamily N-acetyltransferase